MNKTKCLALLATLCIANTAFAGAGLDPKNRQINKELSESTGPVKETLYRTAALMTDQEHNVSFRAKAGYTYQAYGDCDTNCADLDLQLLNSEGVLLAVDSDDDDVPLFDWTAPASGTYTYRLIMVDCAADDCDASLNVYESR